MIQPRQEIKKYTPPHTANLFHQSNDFVRLLMGPVGSGKSTSCCFEVFTRAQEQKRSPDGIRRSRVAIIRNTYGELVSTTIKTWQQWFPQEHFGVIKRGSGPITQMMKWNDVELEVMFLAIDRPEDTRKLLSLELTFAWVNEAREISYETVEALMARIGRYPAKSDGGPSWSGILMDTNPPDVESWIYNLFEIKHPSSWSIFKQPSGMSAQAENKQNLPIRYYENLIETMDTSTAKAYVHGDYSFMSDGRPVFPKFSQEMHVASKKLDPIPYSDIIIGMDFGRTPAAVALQRTASGGHQILYELITEDTSLPDFAEMILQDVRKMFPRNNVEYWGDPSGAYPQQGRDETLFDILYETGLDAQPAGDNSLTPRLEAVHSLLTRLDGIGKPCLLIDPSCTTIIRALAGGYRYRRLNVGGSRFTDKPDKNEYSHVADALQYACIGAGIDPAIGDGTRGARAVTPHCVITTSGRRIQKGTTVTPGQYPYSRNVRH